MKKVENTFTITGFVGRDAEIRQFNSASVARFSLGVGRTEKHGEENIRVSSFLNIEAWRKNENTNSFDVIKKGTMLTVEGYFKPEEYVDKKGLKHHIMVYVAVRFYPTPEKGATPEKSAPCLELY